MNQNIICGFKYITNETGEFFIDENNIKNGLEKILLYNKSPKKTWKENYSNDKSSKKLREFLYSVYPEIFKNINNVSFII